MPPVRENSAPAALACCRSVDGALDADSARRLAGVLRALAEPARLRLMSLIAASAEAGGVCVCDLTAPVGLSQPTVSHHLKILVDAGLLRREQRGRWAYYAVIPGALEEVGSTLSGALAPP